MITRSRPEACPAICPPKSIWTSCPLTGSMPICLVKNSKSWFQSRKSNTSESSRKTPAFLRNLYRIGRQIELLLIDVSIGEVRVDGAHSDQIGRQPVLYIRAAGVQRTPWLT